MSPGAGHSRIPQDDSSYSRPGSPSTLAHSTHNHQHSLLPLLPSHRDRMWSEDKNNKLDGTMNNEPKPHDFSSYPAADPGNPGMHQRTETSDTLRQDHRRSASWDILGGIRRLEHSYVEFDPRRASQAHLVYAEGDMPKNAFVKFYNYLLNVSIITRWFLYIIPVLGMLWIPGILSFTAYPNATVWGVRLLWWSIWLSVVWLGWWGARAVTLVLPHIARHTIGVVAVGARRYIDWLQPLGRYIALFLWSLGVWVSFNPLISTRKQPTATSGDASALSTVAKIFFAILESTLILLAEKVAIQWIASKFHERSYAERVAQQKFAVRVLGDGPPRKRGRLIKRALHGVKVAATTTTTALGNVASEIAGSSVLQPNSPQAVVKTAIESANKSRMTLFYSFVKPGAHSLTDADMAFALECHREQLSIEHSMRDLDSAVGRLDNILMTVYLFIVVLLLAVAFEAQLLTLATTTGTFILSLSWLVGSSFVETLTSIIFLFVKHPYDVGDRISVDTIEYTVKEIRLLSTVMIDNGGTCVQAPHSVLNTKFILNMRRSSQMSETFTFDVAYATTFEQIESCSERRDFQPSFDVSIVDFADQDMMTLTADIRYKSNWQQGALKVTRRNKWITALKTALAQAEVYGPKGPPDPPPPVERVTLVPWEKIDEEDQKAKEEAEAKERAEGKRSEADVGTKPMPQEMAAMQAPQQWTLSDHDAIIMDDSRDVFDQDTMVGSFSSRAPSPRQRPTVMPTAQNSPAEEIELQTTQNRPAQSRSQSAK
ncbi:Mechanosensitive ion channel-domain-containing protein [Fomitopsis serialis]|uniref:Mechanosensitive ion channel-domain-containing protein n=1 Tax=Fomitopsis serialis TaxID=139415 RepID=UPI0020079D30|nr:Mechanosensitive ion channel-domain-containing protein [Neoantrodia serialis]KAH9920051.1 Mechanosensitive ion channel-domain-containing protein [Neoantrodia serialis]